LTLAGDIVSGECYATRTVYDRLSTSGESPEVTRMEPPPRPQAMRVVSDGRVSLERLSDVILRDAVPVYSVIVFQKMMCQASNVLIHSQQPSHSVSSLHFCWQTILSYQYQNHFTQSIMKITALTLLALGASASAYVVPENKRGADNGVEARVSVSFVVGCRLP
jgi:hypothetical protein